jgi:hypothetical protein
MKRNELSSSELKQNRTEFTSKDTMNVVILEN